mgnify:CR=1 FL=1
MAESCRATAATRGRCAVHLVAPPARHVARAQLITRHVAQVFVPPNPPRGGATSAPPRGNARAVDPAATCTLPSHLFGEFRPDHLRFDPVLARRLARSWLEHVPRAEPNNSSPTKGARHDEPNRRSIGEVLWHVPNGAGVSLKCTKEENGLGLDCGSFAEGRVLSLDLVCAVVVVLSLDPAPRL